MFIEDKFQLLRYGRLEEIKYWTSSNHVRDIGVMMLEDLTFKDNNYDVIAATRRILGWITAAFKTSQ